MERMTWHLWRSPIISSLWRKIKTLIRVRAVIPCQTWDPWTSQPRTEVQDKHSTQVCVGAAWCGICMDFFFSIRLLSVLRGHSFFHPRHNGLCAPTSKDFYPRFNPLHFFVLTLIFRKSHYSRHSLSLHQISRHSGYVDVFVKSWILSLYILYTFIRYKSTFHLPQHFLGPKQCFHLLI